MIQQPTGLINICDVPAGEESAFLQAWERTRDFLLTQEGYRSSELSRSASADGNVRFVGVSVWDTEECCHAAMSSVDDQRLNLPHGQHASVYEVIRADQRWDLRSVPWTRAA